MEINKRFLFFSVVAMLTVFLFSSAFNPISENGPDGSGAYEIRQDNLLSDAEQTSPCMAILMEAANQAGVEGTSRIIYDSDSEGFGRGCSVDFSDEWSDDGWAYITTLSLRQESTFTQEMCEYPDFQYPEGTYQTTLFHGYTASTYYHRGETVELGNGEEYTYENNGIKWAMYKDGSCFILGVETLSARIEVYGSAQDPVPIANVLWSIAEERLPWSGTPNNDFDQPISPEDPEEEFPISPEDWSQTPYSDSGSRGTSNVPLVVILGSLGVPVAGAIAGSILSLVLSNLSTAKPGTSSRIPTGAPAGMPKTGQKNQEGLYWSERPYDQAGPGYVSKNEYLRTKGYLDQGYRWTSNGWQTPDQVAQSNQWEQNDRKAVAREDAAWRAKREEDLKALEKNKAELEKRRQNLEDSVKMFDLEDDFNTINQDLINQGKYVLNPYQGDPSVVLYRMNAIKNMVWDNTAGVWTGDTGLTCQGYVDATRGKIVEAVSNRFPGATIQETIIEEKSTVKANKSLGEWFDSQIDDNHMLTKIILPDGSEWALDFHQYNAGKAPLLRPWAEVQKEWRNYLGADEYQEQIWSTNKISPRSSK